MLTAKIMRQFHIKQDWSQAGYYETARAKEIGADIRAAIMAGRLVALSGPVGVGKTVMVKQLQQKITAERKVIFARSLSIDKPRVVLPALMTALFLDISGDPNMKVPSQPERRERLLQEAITDAKKPVVLFIDEAHDLHGNTLNGLKRLMEIVDAGGGTLSVVLVGHPRLQNDLRRATMEEIGHRTTRLEIEGLGTDTRPYLDWLLGEVPDRQSEDPERDVLLRIFGRADERREQRMQPEEAGLLGGGTRMEARWGEPVEEEIDDMRVARLGIPPDGLRRKEGDGDRLQRRAEPALQEGGDAPDRDGKAGDRLHR